MLGYVQDKGGAAGKDKWDMAAAPKPSNWGGSFLTVPAAAPRYTGPVAMLTGGSTVSAGETFTQALMERPGRTVRIGEHTQGVFSDVMRRALPGGWEFMLPNEEFLTRTEATFDGPGVPPHLREPVFTDEELARGRDSAFDRAVAVLSRR